MKDELGGKIMTEFAALGAKMYAYKKIGHLAAQHERKKVEEKRCKGTKKCVVAKALRLMTIRPACLMVKQHTGSNKHKIALNRDDDKRLVQANEITT